MAARTEALSSGEVRLVGLARGFRGGALGWLVPTLGQHLAACLGSLLSLVSFGHIHINVTLTVLRVGVKLTKKIKEPSLRNDPRPTLSSPTPAPWPAVRALRPAAPMIGAVVLRARVLPPVRAAHLRAATSESRYGHSVLLADPMVSPPHRTASRRRCSIALAGVCYVSAISQSQIPTARSSAITTSMQRYALEVTLLSQKQAAA